MVVPPIIPLSGSPGGWGGGSGGNSVVPGGGGGGGPLDGLDGVVVSAGLDGVSVGDKEIGSASSLPARGGT